MFIYFIIYLESKVPKNSHHNKIIKFCYNI